MESCIKNTKKIDYNEEKDTTYAPTEEFYEIPSVNEEGEVSWKRIEAGTQHPVVNEDGTDTLVKVTTIHGREVIATKAKSFLQLKEGKIVGVEGKDLKIGGYLPVSLKPIDIAESGTQLNLREFFPPDKYLYGTEFHKAMKYKDEHRWWMKHHKKDFVLPYSRSDAFKDALKRRETHSWKIEDGFVYIFHGKSHGQVPEYIDLDYDFGYLMGAYVAEGCVTKTQISIANNELAYLEPIERICKKFNITTKIYKHENKIQEGWTSQDIRIYSVMLTQIVEKFGGKLSHNKFVHDAILYSNKECLRGFLDAYIGGDGTTNKKTLNIHASTVSKSLVGIYIKY